MKKIVSILVLVFAFTLTTQGQRKHKKGNFEKLTSEQQATLGAKKMALQLDLSNSQIRQVKALLKRKINDKKEMFTKMKAAKKADKKPTAAERFAHQNARLDKQLAFNNDMKKVLNDEQYQKFKKMKKHRKGKAMKKMKKMKKRKMNKKRKYKR